jgi:hypothetical protein
MKRLIMKRLIGSALAFVAKVSASQRKTARSWCSMQTSA